VLNLQKELKYKIARNRFRRNSVKTQLTVIVIWNNDVNELLKMSKEKSGNNVSETIIIGQRWISEMEPELGLGKILSVDHRRINIAFNDGETVRIYTRENAPLRRIKFKSGDTIRLLKGNSLAIKTVDEKNSLLYYETDLGIICETELSGTNKISAPMDRLLASQVDSIDDFIMRTKILDLQYRIADSPVRGYVGGRIDLIPHQLYIANEISSRFVRRVMLADEVGLGKTIEACMILHRLIVSGRASQILIIVPESMVHVWFVELLRKFNLLFTIIENDNEEAAINDNPFVQSSLLLIGMNLFVSSKELTQHATHVDWDMVIVDEAHHLVEGSAAFDIVNLLSKKTKDLFLLTATPQHYGEHNHFSRLRLLDPSRYTSFNEHCKEAEEHKKIAEITGKILDGINLNKKDLLLLKNLENPENAIAFQKLQTSDILSESDRKQIVAEIIDRQGIGRALFRNTRAVIGGFPQRSVHISVLECKKAVKENAIAILKEDQQNQPANKNRKLTSDPRVDFVADLLRSLGEEKVLVICRSKYSVFALEDALKKLINVNMALFHEDLTLLQRDRNAAYFSEEEGARILICSEIGSEGRNFQFAHHLVLFDLPSNPELVEQRIGRLDRIGQKCTVNLYVTVLTDTSDAFLARWYNEGLGIFNATVPAAQEVYERFYDTINNLLKLDDYSKNEVNSRIDELISNTKTAVSEISERLKCGRDRLLEQHSFRPKEAETLVSLIKKFDNDNALKDIMRGLFRARGILAEEFQNDTWNLLSESQIDESFPGLSPSRSIITFNRAKAIHREDYEFLTIDHPAVTGGIDLFLSSNSGNTCFAKRKNSLKTELFMQAVFVIECIAPPALYMSRFLPPRTIQITIDNKKIDRSDNSAISEDMLENIKTFPLLEKNEIRQKLLPAMLKQAQVLATEKCTGVINEALEKIKLIAGTEVERLISLQNINPSISHQEIELAKNEYLQLTESVSKASPRLDAIRLIWCPGPEIQ
jgi:ATP-dependent helicase HepA